MCVRERVSAWEVCIWAYIVGQDPKEVTWPPEKASFQERPVSILLDDSKYSLVGYMLTSSGFDAFIHLKYIL